MAHLLHIDSSINGDRSVSRALSARAAEAWKAAHPGGTVTYRDLGANPVPHLDSLSGSARAVPPEQHTPEQAASWALTEELVGEIKAADTVLLGLPLYNFGPPSSVKAWVDHLIAPGPVAEPRDLRGLPDRQGVRHRRRPRRRLWPRHPARGLGPRDAVDPARALVDRPRADEGHSRRADPRQGQPGHGRAHPLARREPRRRRARDRRALGSRRRLTASSPAAASWSPPPGSSRGSRSPGGTRRRRRWPQPWSGCSRP